MGHTLSAALYLVALINPISKVFLLSMLADKEETAAIREASIRASVVALALLLILAAVGNSIFTLVFHVELHSLRVAGGIVLFAIGYQALTRGVFFETTDADKLAEISLVPLASPMIAGPATITAAISFPPAHGLGPTALAILIAVIVNLVIMLFSRHIGAVLMRFNLMGALIRITGLIVATIAAEMVLSGLGEWYASLASAA